YAERGAARVVGIDFAEAMIDLAREYAGRLGVADQCELIPGAFPDVVPPGEYDASTAMGFFDYIENPVPLLAAMREITRETIVMSFPKAREWRVPVRRLRFKMLRCPLFLYSETRVKTILRDAGIQRYDWIPLDRDYVIVGHLNAT